MKKIKLTIEEIEKYWGSLAAYNEEQRRVGLCELEIKAGSDHPARLDFRPAPTEGSPAISQMVAPVELSPAELNHLAFVRWLYLTGQLES